MKVSLVVIEPQRLVANLRSIRIIRRICFYFHKIMLTMLCFVSSIMFLNCMIRDFEIPCTSQQLLLSER